MAASISKKYKNLTLTIFTATSFWLIAPNANAGFVYTPAESTNPVADSVSMGSISIEKKEVIEVPAPVIEPEIIEKEVVKRVRIRNNEDLPVINDNSTHQEVVKPGFFKRLARKLNLIEEGEVVDYDGKTERRTDQIQIKNVVIEKPKTETIKVEKVTAPIHRTKPFKEMIDGFAKDIPLKMALEQIIPGHYKVILEEGVNDQALVSWEGGYSRDDVLMRTLANSFLYADIKEDAVIIKINKRYIENYSYETGKELITDHEVSFPVTDKIKGMSETPAAPKIIKENDVSEIIEEITSKEIAVVEQIDVDDLTIPETLHSDISAINEPENIYHNDDMVIDTLSLKTWQARQNTSLETILIHWSEREEVEVYYNTSEKYYIKEPFYFKGHYAEAVNEILMSFSKYGTRPVGKLHTADAGAKPILVIESE